MGRTTAIIIAVIAVALGGYLFLGGTSGEGDSAAPTAENPAIEVVPEAGTDTETDTAETPAQ